MSKHENVTCENCGKIVKQIIMVDVPDSVPGRSYSENSGTIVTEEGKKPCTSSEAVEGEHLIVMLGA